MLFNQVHWSECTRNLHRYLFFFREVKSFPCWWDLLIGDNDSNLMSVWSPTLPYFTFKISEYSRHLLIGKNNSNASMVTNASSFNVQNMREGCHMNNIHSFPWWWNLLIGDNCSNLMSARAPTLPQMDFLIWHTRAFSFLCHKKGGFDNKPFVQVITAYVSIIQNWSN